MITEISKKTKHKCPHCPKYLSSASNLTRHIKQVHRQLRPYKCEFCGDSFKEQGHLDNHKEAKHAENPKLVDCPEPDCGLKFKNSKELDKHLRQFHIVTDHQCPKCKMYLASRGSLHNHKKTCLDERNFKCSECGDTFFQKHHLDDHIKYKHSKERNYVCDVKVRGKVCGKSFKTETGLNNHKKTHSDEKPHQCPHCKKAYKTLKPLRTHVYKEHQEEYQQSEESLKLEQSETEDLRKDENNNQSDETRHACPYCEKTYKYQKTLQNHIKEKHPESRTIQKENDPQVEE